VVVGSNPGIVYWVVLVTLKKRNKGSQMRHTT
jgi:hypothetical protein